MRHHVHPQASWFSSVSVLASSASLTKITDDGGLPFFPKLVGVFLPLEGHLPPMKMMSLRPHLTHLHLTFNTLTIHIGAPECDVKRPVGMNLVEWKVGLSQEYCYVSLHWRMHVNEDLRNNILDYIVNVVVFVY